MSNILHKSSIHTVYDDVLLQPEHAVKGLMELIEESFIRPQFPARGNTPWGPYGDMLRIVGAPRLLIAEQCIIYIEHERN